MMTAAEAAEAAKGLTFEKVWMMMQETDRQMQETDRQMRELSQAADRRQEEAAKQIKELSKNIGGLNNSFGKWVEEMVSAKLWEKFKAIGYTFTQGGPRKFWEQDRTIAQVDMFLENGDYAMPVEIKSELTQEDIDEHIERIEKVRKQLDKRGDQRKLVGAVAAMVVPEHVREYAQKRGLYVLVQSGDSVIVAEAPQGFKVREWCA
ncbi:hypothetical protein LQZ21_13300 [Treponema sp. TIM-1]|uniref:hypothetical protein n=1 Tax=Treponema sp. TIM-1 TaxID=2898417 RepID=UPI00397F941D